MYVNDKNLQRQYLLSHGKEETDNGYLYLVYVGTAFPNIVLTVFLVLGTLHFQQSCSLVLCPQTTLVASEDSFGIEPTRPREIFLMYQPYKYTNKLCIFRKII